MQLCAHLRSNDLYLIDTKIREKESVLQSRDHGRVSRTLEFIKRTQDAAPCLVAIIHDCLGRRSITLIGIRPGAQGIFFQQKIGDCQRTAVVQVQLACRSIGLQRIDDLNLALIECFLAGLPHIQVDQHFVVRDRAQALNLRLRQAYFSQGFVDCVVIGRVRELYVDKSSAPEVDAQRDPMPKQHGEYSRHAEHQRKGEKIPLLAQKVYVWISKKFHAVVKPLLLSLLQSRSSPFVRLQTVP